MFLPRIITLLSAMSFNFHKPGENGARHGVDCGGGLSNKTTGRADFNPAFSVILHRWIYCYTSAEPGNVQATDLQSGSGASVPHEPKETETRLARCRRCFVAITNLNLKFPNFLEQ